jgi:CheY-like chemotaxis protein
MRHRAVILDDNASIRNLLWTFFDSRGYEVFAFPDPQLCPLHTLHECPCPAESSCADIFVSDVKMENGNGIEFLETLIQKGCRQRHFALMSGNFSEADQARAKRLNCKLFPKPLDIAQLTAWLEEVERSIPAGRILHNWV